MAFKMKGFPMMGNESVQADQVKSQVGQGGEIKSFEDIIPGLREYNEHQTNTPQFKKDGSVGDHFNTYMSKIVHNLTGPPNPNINTGGGALDLIGGKGAVKLFSKGFAKLFAKQAAKKAVQQINK